MVLCGLGMQQYAMHNATIQKTTFFELGVDLEDVHVKHTPWYNVELKTTYNI